MRKESKEHFPCFVLTYSSPQQYTDLLKNIFDKQILNL